VHKSMNLLPDWMYHAIEESFTCQLVTITAKGTPLALPVYLHHFNPDTGMLIFTSPLGVKRLDNIRERPKVAALFSPVGGPKGGPAHVLLVQGRAEVDDADPENGWKRYFAGWARRQVSARESLPKIRQAMPGYTQRGIIRVSPTRFLGWPEGAIQQAPEVVEVKS